MESTAFHQLWQEVMQGNHFYKQEWGLGGSFM